MKSFIEKTMISGTALLIISTGSAFASHSSVTESLRGSLTEKEQIRLVMEEDKSLSFTEAKELSKMLSENRNLALNTMQGHFREGLNDDEKRSLVLEEKKYLTNHEYRFNQVHHNDFESKDDYAHGEFRANLSEKERKALEREERYGK